MRRLAGVFFFRNFFLSLIVGALTGFVVSSISPSKKGATLDVILGVVGAFLGGLFLNILKVGPTRFFGLLLFQVLGALLVVGLGRLLNK